MRRDEPQPGIKAIYHGICPKCHGPIVRAESRVYAKRGEWIHVECAPGRDDQ